jgi:hypothetical protein
LRQVLVGERLEARVPSRPKGAVVVNREVLLELLSNKDRTFREASPTGALRAVRDEIVRGRVAEPTRAPVDREDAAAPRTEIDDIPLAELPEMAALLEHAHLHVVASFVEGDDRWVDAAAAAVGGPGGLDAAALERLVLDQQLDEATAGRVGFMAALYETVDRDTKLMRIVREARFSSSDGPARPTLDLARTSRDEWTSALLASGTSDIDGRPISEIAARLADRFAAIHPGPAFIARLDTADERVSRAIADVEPLFARNAKVHTVPTEQLDLAGLDGDRARSATVAHRLLRAAIAKYPDLELPPVLDDRARTVDERAAIVVRRLGYVRQFQRAVGEDRVLFLDYGPRSADLAPLAELGASADEATMVRRTLKTHQRAYALAGSPEAASTLLGHGFANARAIAKLDLATFRNRVGAGVDARSIHERATKLAADAAIVAASLLDLVEDPHEGQHRPEFASTRARRCYARRVDSATRARRLTRCTASSRIHLVGTSSDARSSSPRPGLTRCNIGDRGDDRRRQTARRVTGGGVQALTSNRCARCVEDLVGAAQARASC